jgi:hypothetical protein
LFRAEAQKSIHIRPAGPPMKKGQKRFDNEKLPSALSFRAFFDQLSIELSNGSDPKGGGENFFSCLCLD